MNSMSDKHDFDPNYNVIYLKDRKRSCELDLSKYGDVREQPQNNWLDEVVIFLVIGGCSLFLYALIGWVIFRSIYGN